MKKQEIIFLVLLLILSAFALFVIAKGGGGGGSPPPPPPPCAIQGSGCYRTGDVRADFGSLAPGEFSYFLPEDKCNRIGTCDCRNVPDNAAQQTDPDASSGACTCIARTDWSTQGKCCGDDVGSSNVDCERIVSGSICSAGTSEQQSNWVSSSANVGDIRHLGCSGAEYLSDGTSWIKCDGTVWKNTINNNEYVCIGRGRESIVECCGDSSCNSRIDGKRLTTGLSIRNPPVGTVISSPSATPPSSSSPSTTQVNLVSDVQAIRATGESSCTTLGSSWQKFGYDSTSSITYCLKKAQPAQPPAQFINGVAAVWTGDGGGEINCAAYSGLAPDWQKVIFDSVSDITFCKHFATISQASRFVDDLRNVQPSPNHGVTGQTCSSLGDDWTEYAYNGQSDITFCYHLANIQSTPTTTSPTPTPPTITPSTNYINITNYCRADGKFVAELDTPEPNRGDAAINNKNRVTCERAGFKWTGTKCCSEDDDNLSTSTLREFYNDAGGNGGCWNSTYVRGVDFVNGTKNSTVSYNGEFHGCAIDRRNFNTENDNLLALRDKHSGAQLITNHDYCFNDQGRNIYCSYTERWMLTNGADKTHLSTAPTMATTTSGTSTSSQSGGPCAAAIKVFDYNLITGKPARVRAISNKPGKIEIFAEGLTSQSGIIKIQECGSVSSGVTECTYSSGISLPDSYSDIVVRYYAELTTSSEHVASDSKIAQIGSQNRNNNNFCTDETHIVLNGGANSQGVLCNTPPTNPSASNICQTGACTRESGNIVCTYPSNCQNNDPLRTILPLCSGVTPSAPSGPSGVPTPIIASECCSQSQCWNGTSCTSNQRGNPQAQPINGYRCVDGSWSQSRLKFSPDMSKSGYCPRGSQCLLDPFGNNESSQCVESDQFVNDNYCENGNWSSRTKILALKLLRISSGDYTLFCDNRNNALNNLQYITGSGEIVADILNNLQTNNFCVLKTASNVIAATSINRNLGDVAPNSLNILGVTSCDNAQIDDGQYHACDASNKAWFNKRLKSFIYSATPISIPQDANLLASSDELINNPIRAITESIRRLITNPPFDESYVSAIKKFDRLYFTRQGVITVKGAIEGLNFKNAVIQYSGFNTDICSFVTRFNAARSDVSSGIACQRDGSNYFVLVQGSQFTNLNPDSVWPDLTSKLRVT